VCIGLNYAKHAAESGVAPPKEPVIFLKATSSLVGPNDDVVIPRGSQKTDWEVELAAVIGKRASYVNEASALDYVAGYCLHNDYSERAYQLERGGQWDKGKSCDTFAPLGPFLVTKDEIPNPHSLHLWLQVNGVMRQDSSTSDLIFNLPTLISYVSEFMTLLPGDVLSTGTPSGVGMGLKPPTFLKAGDVVQLGIDGLGVARQRLVAYEAAAAAAR
jgi:2-keto-4-pentenoate hydratase/2-oxohepta-3-ene-1,7-dioic acid hydratase in catechol pathway